MISRGNEAKETTSSHARTREKVELHILSFLLDCLGSEVLERKVVSVPNRPDTFTFVRDAIGVRPLFEERTDAGVLVLGHRGKEMMFELILHAAPQPFHEEVITPCVTGGQKLRLDKRMIRVDEHLFALMRGGDDAGDQQTAEKNGAERHLPAERVEPQVVDGDEQELDGVRGSEYILQRLPSPAQIQQ